MKWKWSVLETRRPNHFIFAFSSFFVLNLRMHAVCCTISLFSLLTDFSFLAGQPSPIIMIISLFDCLMPFDILPFNSCLLLLCVRSFPCFRTLKLKQFYILTRNHTIGLSIVFKVLHFEKMLNSSIWSEQLIQRKHIYFFCIEISFG